MSDEKENAALGNKSDANNGTTINTDAVSTELDEDGVPIIHEGGKWLERDKPLTEQEKADLEAEIAKEDAEEDSFNTEQWNEYRKGVEWRWNQEAVKKIAFADYVLGPIDKHGDKIPKEEWWSKVAESRSMFKLPAIVSASMDEHPEFTHEEPKQVIRGMLYAGCKLVLGGPSKSYKTWNLTALGMAVATGTPWLGMETTQGKVLYLNFELTPFTFQKRRIRVRNALGFTAEQVKDFHAWELKGYATDIESLLPDIVRQAESGGYDLILLDPIYKVYGDKDENSAGNMGTIVNALDRICTQSGAAIAFGAHFPKGNMDSRKAMDRIAGSGVFSRDPEVILTIM